MPNMLAEAKSVGKSQEQADDGESYKLGRGSMRGGGNDAKGDLGGSVPWGADSKECQQQGENRGKMLSSLAKQASPRPSEMQAFSSLPSPSADSGKLAPLDMGQRSPRSHRASRSRQRSSSPKEHQNASSEDESPLPGLSLSPRSGAHSARRVRSLPPTPKRASCTNLDPVSDSVEFARPQSRGGPAGNGSKFSPLLDAKEGSTSPRYRDPALCAADSNKRGGELAAERGGGGLGRESRSLSRGAAEAKSEVGCTRLPGTKSTSPPRDRGEGSEGRPRLSSESLPGASPSSSNGTWRRQRSSQNVDAAHSTKRSSGDVSPAGGERNGNHRYEGYGEEKDFGSVPNSPSMARGEESSKSPRTRRMRPQRDSAV
ncbi:hypothetical protein Esi_0005_0084 [Ectocarpus siliculosus]|uniref:Uncharacterized protein n=1 Tax=Ectocarpus siliculosus TaxID=2880 RepID=D8LNP2_ECTSI|nr:hypothetical protein Esi_0005_0084 [Ectocarpus siliculosus]|eukprot:CBN78252.1 hypothetical protein Esi_0005_0084 [Ectocarpus siliculosus]